MDTISPPDFYGHSIFCDDIRQEMNGKVTFVGAYTDHMVVHGAFPCLLPKFGVWIQYNQRPSLVIKPIQFAIFLPTDSDDKPSILLQIPDEQTDQAIAKSGYLAKDLALSEDKNPVYVGLGSHTTFSPFIIPSPGLIKVRAIRNDKLVRLGSLAVYAAPGPTVLKSS
jgi:hypothetical protein